MTALLVAGVVVTWMAAACGAMFVYQLLRQNGRMLARLDALERELGPAAGRTRAPSFGDRSLAGMLRCVPRPPYLIHEALRAICRYKNYRTMRNYPSSPQ